MHDKHIFLIDDKFIKCVILIISTSMVELFNNFFIAGLALYIISTEGEWGGGGGRRGRRGGEKREEFDVRGHKKLA